MATNRLVPLLSCIGCLSGLPVAGLAQPVAAEGDTCVLTGRIQPAGVEATIWAVHLPTNTSYWCEAEADGSYSLTGPPGEYEIMVTPARPYALFEYARTVAVKDAERLELGDVLLPLEGVITGRVVGGTPGTAVWPWRVPDPDKLPLECLSRVEADGEAFTIGGLPEGTYDLVVVVPGRGIVRFVYRPPGARRADATARGKAEAFAQSYAHAMTNEDWDACAALYSRQYADSEGLTFQDLAAPLRSFRQTPPPTKISSLRMDFLELWVADTELVCLVNRTTEHVDRESGARIGEVPCFGVWRLVEEEDGVTRTRAVEPLTLPVILQQKLAWRLAGRPEDPVMASTPVIFRFSPTFAGIKVRAGETTTLPDLDASEVLPPAEE